MQRESHKMNLEYNYHVLLGFFSTSPVELNYKKEPNPAPFCNLIFFQERQPQLGALFPPNPSVLEPPLPLVRLRTVPFLISFGFAYSFFKLLLVLPISLVLGGTFIVNLSNFFGFFLLEIR